MVSEGLPDLPEVELGGVVIITAVPEVRKKRSQRSSLTNGEDNLQAFNPASLQLYKPRILQASSSASIECCKPPILQASHSARLQLCRPPALQALNSASLKLCKPPTLQASDSCKPPIPATLQLCKPLTLQASNSASHQFPKGFSPLRWRNRAMPKSNTAIDPTARKSLAFCRNLSQKFVKKGGWWKVIRQ